MEHTKWIEGFRGSNGDPIKNIFISATVHLPYKLNSHSLTLSKLHLKIKFTFFMYKYFINHNKERSWCKMPGLKLCIYSWVTWLEYCVRINCVVLLAEPNVLPTHLHTLSGEATAIHRGEPLSQTSASLALSASCFRHHFSTGAVCIFHVQCAGKRGLML